MKEGSSVWGCLSLFHTKEGGILAAGSRLSVESYEILLNG
jgi:hypothetical protein